MPATQTAGAALPEEEAYGSLCVEAYRTIPELDDRYFQRGRSDERKRRLKLLETLPTKFSLTVTGAAKYKVQAHVRALVGDASTLDDADKEKDLVEGERRDGPLALTATTNPRQRVHRGRRPKQQQGDCTAVLSQQQQQPS